MTQALAKAGLASTLVETCYVKLRELSFEDKEDTEEFKAIVSKLKKMVPGENQLYEELNNEDVVFAINSLIKKDIDSLAAQRIYLKLKDAFRKRTNSNITTELGNIISSKILIDVLKSLNQKLHNFNDGSLLSDEKENLLAYAQAYKYNYLAANPYIEGLAIAASFNIEDLPDIKFDEIESTFQMQFVDKSSELFLTYIKDSIEELLNAKSEDEYLNVHVALFEVSRVEVMLPYLNKENLEKLIQYINTLKYENNDIAIRNIKRLIKKRKEELQ